VQCVECVTGILADVASEEEEDILLQIFTTPLYDRPTFFLEVISRLGNCAGFGEKTIKTLFEAVEKQRKLALS
jgi:4-hydroxyphenylpyruvate dioxygenase